MFEAISSRKDFPYNMGSIIFFALLGATIPIFTFALTYYLTKWWIPIGKKLGFVGRDINKYDKPEVTEIGGFFALISISISTLIYIAFKTYIIGSVSNIVEIFVIETVVSLALIIGLFDDILGWKVGIKHWKRVLLTFLLALPLMVTASGVSKITLPFIGTVDVGILYPLLLVPIGIVGASNAFNMIAGYNGLETSMALILFSFLAIKSFYIGAYYITFVSLIVISSLLAFLLFNKYPAKVFPGNSFTYGIGALYGSLIILGNMEKFGVITYTLYFIELLLFLRGLKDGIYKENFGIPDKNNCLKEPYKKVYSITHLAIKLNRKLFKCATEPKVVGTILTLQAIVCLIALLI